MKIAIMQPYLFPYIGYYQAIHSVDKYILYGNLNYIKEGWVNKNRILVKNGSPAYFIANVKNKSSFKKINDIELIENNSWRRKILNSVFLNYKKSTFFESVYPLIESVFNYQTNLLVDLNIKSITEVSKYLDIPATIEANPQRYQLLEKNLEDEDYVKLSLVYDESDLALNKKVIRVLEICNAEKATTFINAYGGRDLYSKEIFRRYGILLNFIETQQFTYKQDSKEFFPNLSIIDVLMNCGTERTKELLTMYKLI